MKLVVISALLLIRIASAEFIGGSYYFSDKVCYYGDNPRGCVEKKPEEEKKLKEEKKLDKKIVVIYNTPPEPEVTEKKKVYKMKVGKYDVPIKEDIPEPVAKAIADPTEENILEAMKFMKEYFDTLNRFRRRYEAVALKYPDLFPRLYPVGLGEANWLDPLLEQIRAKQRKEIQKRIGLIYFYRVSCPVCVAFKRFIVDLTDKGWLFLGVGVDGIDRNLPFKSVINPTLIEKFRVVRVPTIVAIDKDTQEWRTVSVGLTPIELIEKRIFDFAYDLDIIKEGIYEGFEDVKVLLNN